MRLRVHFRIKLAIGLMLLSHAALAAAHRAHQQKQREPPPDELYYADSCADHYQIPRELVHAIITVESGWNPHAVSNKNAQGLMQLMPGTAARYGVTDRFSKVDNTCGGAHYLADLIHEFGDMREAVAAYYCGGRHIEHRGLKYSNAGVNDYVKAVRSLYVEELKKEGLYDDQVASR